MNIKYLGILVLIIAVLAGGYFLLKGQSYSPSPDSASTLQVNGSGDISPTSADVLPSKTPTTQPSGSSVTNSQQTVVEYTSTGFVPKSITVKVNTTVSWVNKDSDDVWVASAPHPQHTDLPGFDALKGYKTGESYSYTFTKVGNWKYHNHLNPSNFGVVIVEQ